MLKNIMQFAKTRKFWTSVVGGLVTFLTMAFDSPSWLSTLTLVLTSLGIYQVPNKK